MLPVDQVLTFGMSPVQRTPGTIIGIILIKEVILSAEIDESIWVIDSANWSGEMGTWFKSLIYGVLLL